MLKWNNQIIALVIVSVGLSSFATELTIPLGIDATKQASICEAYPNTKVLTVQETLLGVSTLNKGDVISFLSEQGELKGTVTYANTDVNGMNARAGMLEKDLGLWRLVAGPNVLYGVVEDFVTDTRYEITGLRKNGVYEVRARSYSEFCSQTMAEAEEIPSYDSPVISSPTILKLTPEQDAWAANWDDDEEVELTIMVIFSPLTVKAYGSLEAANAEVAAGIALGNQVMQNSKINAILTCVGTFLSDYDETGNSYLDINRLGMGIDGFEFVSELRNKLGADFVCYAPKHMSPGIAGIGILNGNPKGSDNYSYCHVVAPLSSLVWIHEWGHNIGCEHSYEQSSNPGSQDGGLFAHSLGCYFYATNLNKRCCSIMAYPGKWKEKDYEYWVPFFSDSSINYGGSAVYYNSKTRNATTWQKMRKYVSLYRTPPALTEFNTGFESSEGYCTGLYRNDATWQQGLVSLGAIGTIENNDGNYYLHTHGGEGFQQSVNVKSKNGEGTFVVSILVNPSFGGTSLDIMGPDGALCGAFVNGSGELIMKCSDYPGGPLNKDFALQKLLRGWQTWTFYIQESTKAFIGWSVNGEYHDAEDCYVFGKNIYISSLRMKDSSSNGADFDDIHVDCGIGKLSIVAKNFELGSQLTSITLTNLVRNTTIQYKATLLKGGEHFTLSPIEGVFSDDAAIQVYAFDLPDKPEYVEGIVEISAGNAGKKTIRLGAPCGSEDEGYVFYAADFPSFEKGPVSDYDHMWAAGADSVANMNYFLDNHIEEVLLDENFENYPADTDLNGLDGWSLAPYLGGDGTINIKEEAGNKYVELTTYNVNDICKFYKSFEKKIQPGWWQKYAKGYFRISFDVKFNGINSISIGLWPFWLSGECFQRSSKNGMYTFRSRGFDKNHPEFLSEIYMSSASWHRVSMIMEAYPELGDDGETYHHILRQYKADDKTENCIAFLNDVNKSDISKQLYFSLTHNGTVCFDNLKVEALVSQKDYENLDFADKDPVNLFITGTEGAFLNIDFTDLMARKYDLVVNASIFVPCDLSGTINIGQDNEHRQFTTVLSVKNDELLPRFPDCAEAEELLALKGAEADGWFDYGYTINTYENILRSINWNGAEIKANLAIEGAAKTSDVDALRFASSDETMRLKNVEIRLVPAIPEPRILLLIAFLSGVLLFKQTLFV